MSFNQAITAIAPSTGSQVHRLAGRATLFATVLSGGIIDWLLPSGRRVGRVIGLASTVIVLFIAAFAGLVLREIGESAHASSQAHVEQLVRAVTYQVGTILFMVERTMNEASNDIRKDNDPGRIAELGSDGQVASKLLNGFFFINPEGRVVASTTAPVTASDQIDLSDRPYFRIHLGSLGTDTRIGRPVVSRLTGMELIPISHPVRRPNGELIGVLVAMIDVVALGRIWMDIGLRPDDVIELIGEDGAAWLSWPHRAIASDDLTSSRQVAGWPMYAIARLDQATANRQDFAARRAIVVSATAGSLMVGLFGFLLANRARQAARERDAGDAIRARLLAAVSAIPVEYIEYDRDRRLILANQAARDASPWRVPGAARGKTVDEVMESYAVHFQGIDTAQEWKAWSEQTIADFDRGGVADSRRPDGQWRRSYVSDMPGGGRVVVRVDITEMKRREQQLAFEMERLNSVVQSTGAGITMLDRDGRVVLVNQSVLDSFGKTAAEVIGRSYTELGIKGIDTVFEGWQNASGPQCLETLTYERNIVHPDGTKHVLKVTANPVQDEAGRLRHIVIFGVDDTERRLAEIRLFDSSRLANLGEMATGMAHEINQPLAVIRMAAESLIEEFESPEAAAIPEELAAFVKAKLDRISKQTERASSLVNDLRAVARKPTNDSLPFDLVETVRIADDLLHEQLRAGRVEFAVALPPPGLMVRGEASRLQQVILNLVLNARDALLENPAQSSTGTLGHIALRVVAAPTGGAILTIEDDGPGIPIHVLPRLFEPFFTTKPTGKGTGLGLSISYDIIKRMGGDITAENRPEGGARFTIVLPPADAVGED